MNSSVLKQIISNNKSIPSLLIFIENEPINARAYVDLIAKKINKPVVIYDTADNVLYDLTTGLVSDRLYYILNDKQILKNQNYIASLNSFNENIIVGFRDIEISDNFLNDNAQFIYTFEKGDTETLLAYIKRKYKTLTATDNQLKHLISYSDNRLSQINNELDKVVLLSENEQNKYFSDINYPDIRYMDNMSVMLMIINKNKDFLKHINSLIDNAIPSMLAIYTMARKKFVVTNDKYYAKLMILCFKAHSSIIDGTMTSENAINKFVGDLI